VCVVAVSERRGLGLYLTLALPDSVVKTPRLSFGVSLQDNGDGFVAETKVTVPLPMLPEGRWADGSWGESREFGVWDLAHFVCVGGDSRTVYTLYRTVVNRGA